MEIGVLYLKVCISRCKINTFVMSVVVKQNGVFVTEFLHNAPLSEAVLTCRFCDFRLLFHIVLKSYRNLFISMKSFIDLMICYVMLCYVMIYGGVPAANAPGCTTA